MTKLEDFLIQYSLSPPQSWDNTGLLIDCQSPCDRIFLTIDVTPSVIAECIEKNINFILSYHPVIFNKLHRIEKSYIELIKNNISVYSIHTALDRKMCTYLCESLNAKATTIEDSYLIGNTRDTVKQVLIKCKEMTGNRAIRYALADSHTMEHVPESIIIGVGSAQTVFKNFVSDSLIITGEMGHHDMLFYKSNGCSVVLMEHSNCERIYLKRFKKDLESGGFQVEISEKDADPVSFFI